MAENNESTKQGDSDVHLSNRCRQFWDDIEMNKLYDILIEAPPTTNIEWDALVNRYNEWATDNHYIKRTRMALEGKVNLLRKIVKDGKSHKFVDKHIQFEEARRKVLADRLAKESFQALVHNEEDAPATNLDHSGILRHSIYPRLVIPIDNKRAQPPVDLTMPKSKKQESIDQSCSHHFVCETLSSAKFMLFCQKCGKIINGTF